MLAEEKDGEQHTDEWRESVVGVGVGWLTTWSKFPSAFGSLCAKTWILSSAASITESLVFISELVLNSGAKLQQKPQTAVTQFAAKIALFQENGDIPLSALIMAACCFLAAK